jgi:ATP synthase protein I
MDEPLDHGSRPAFDTDAGQDEPPFQPLTPQEAQAWKARNPWVSPWRIVAAQAALGLVCALVVWWITRRDSAAWSALYGMGVVVLPGSLLARGMAKRTSNPAAAAAGFMFWEMVKIAVAVTMLVVAVKVVPDLSWPALLVTMVVCMKMGWLVLLCKRRPPAVTTT